MLLCSRAESREQHSASAETHISSPGLPVAVASDFFCFDPLPVASINDRSDISGVRITNLFFTIADLADLHGCVFRDKNWEAGIKQHARLSGVDDIFAYAVGQI